jgi:D-cysteine desulfhydrase
MPDSDLAPAPADAATPLTRRFPGTGQLPHVALGVWPTPVTDHSALAEQLGVRSLTVKRDDVTAIAYGGNKVRKLEYLLGAAREVGAASVITFGAWGSNHVLATAVHGGRLGFSVHAVLTPQHATGYLRHNLLADVAAGVAFHLAESFEAAPRVAAGVRSELRAAGEEPFVIPFGGTNALGTTGFVNAAFELAEQIAAGALPEPHAVYVPLGSMGTAAGLALGFAAAGLATRVQAVRVVPAAPSDPDALARTVAEAVVLLRDADASFPGFSLSDLNLTVREEFLGEGYAIPTDECRSAVSLAAEHGIGLETTYTGKALAALIADAADGSLAQKDVLFWDTYNSREVAEGDEAGLPEGLRELGA